MSKKVKPIVTIKESIVHPSGDLRNNITVKELEKHPEKYVKLYPHAYANLKELLHYLNTATRAVSGGSKVHAVSKKMPNGTAATIFKSKKSVLVLK